MWSCDGGTFVAPNKITVPLGGAVTCTIINTDDSPTLKLVKDVQNNDGGTKIANDWTLSAAAAAPNDGRNFSNFGGLGTFKDVFAGAEYTLSEDPNAGTGYSTTGVWSCTGGGTFVAPNKITVPLGGAVTCTIINTDDTPTLKLVKTVTNNDGGTAVANDWTLSAAAAAPNDGRNFNNLGGSGTFKDVFADAVYTLSENPNPGAGYSTTGVWSCDGGTFVSPNKITVPLGGGVTCTITNTDDTPTLKLVKNVTNNDGGTKTAADWKLSAGAAAPNDGRNFDSQTASPVFHNVLGGIEYTLIEDPNAGTGYSTTGVWNCDGGTFVSPNKITVPLGGAVTCTITNTDDTPTLKLVKTVTNDNGGLKTADDWTLSAAAAAPNAGRNFNNLGGSGTFKDVFANAVYTLSENPNPGAGYSTTGIWSCDGGTFESPNKITVPLGTDVTCTIINDDKPGTIVIIKNAKPASGVFTYPTTGSTSGPGTSWPASFTLNGDPTGGGNTKTFTVDAGTYTVTEQTQLGWILTGSADRLMRTLRSTASSPGAVAARASAT